MTAIQGLSQLGGYGLALGALVVLWRLHLAAIARERSTTDYERTRAQASEDAKDALHAEMRRLQQEQQQIMTERVIPVLTRATDGLLLVAEDQRDQRDRHS